MIRQIRTNLPSRLGQQFPVAVTWWFTPTMWTGRQAFTLVSVWVKTGRPSACMITLPMAALWWIPLRSDYNSPIIPSDEWDRAGYFARRRLADQTLRL